MKISVIIPAYNGAATLAEPSRALCVKPACRDEIIVCDDCSTDATCRGRRALRPTDRDQCMRREQRWSFGQPQYSCSKLPRATGSSFSIRTTNCFPRLGSHSPGPPKRPAPESPTATSCSEAIDPIRPASMGWRGRRASHRFRPRQISGGRRHHHRLRLVSPLIDRARWVNSTRRSGRRKIANSGCVAAMTCRFAHCDTVVLKKHETVGSLGSPLAGSIWWRLYLQEKFLTWCAARSVDTRFLATSPRQLTDHALKRIFHKKAWRVLTPVLARARALAPRTPWYYRGIAYRKDFRLAASSEPRPAICAPIRADPPSLRCKAAACMAWAARDRARSSFGCIALGRQRRFRFRCTCWSPRRPGMRESWRRSVSNTSAGGAGRCSFMKTVQYRRPNERSSSSILPGVRFVPRPEAEARIPRHLSRSPEMPVQPAPSQSLPQVPRLPGLRTLRPVRRAGLRCHFF